MSTASSPADPTTTPPSGPSATAPTASLFEPLTLPGGAVVPNRIAKAAMEENMSASGQLPGRQLQELYRRWSRGGTGLLITGNVMVHAEALTGPAGVVLDDRAPLEPFVEWARAAKSGGASVWMQVNHPGRQVRASMPGVAWAPSAVPLDMGRSSRLFAQPVEMTEAQIRETIERFVTTAVRAEQAGFDGVEVHAAHGYLLSQFLSPLVNRRHDEWGGSLANRARMLTEIVAGVRARTAPGFAVAVKLNSADFQRGGFDADDARQVIDLLAPLGVDLVELSGGSYESPAMSGRPADERTRAREAYFLDLAEQLVHTSPVPLMVTGGVVRRSVAEEVLASGVAMVGMGTALAVDPDLPAKWRGGIDASVELAPVTLKDKTMASAVGMARVRHQLHRLGRHRAPQPQVQPLLAFGLDDLRSRAALRRYRRWLSRRPSHQQS